ncbi:DUF4126 domain-containing protein [Mycolicibacterium diernhoferi]|uniref:DUF4126 domain-containing protein n=1 Tax=Mycolicibacterium diernhoferi TaxID=1801 RepID=UPI001F1F279A|nr:DUF4126 domain-containing protein [Mycolicibacterium diernhoferi]
MSLTKSAVRPVANLGSAGMAAPVLSTAEDVTSVGLVFVSLLLPLLVLVALALVAFAVFQVWRRRRRKPTATG